MFKNTLVSACTAADKREAICLALKSIPHTWLIHLQLHKVLKTNVALALLSWQVIGYSLRVSNAYLVDLIFKPMRITVDVNNVNCGLLN